jgi:hypothetical protein
VDFDFTGMALNDFDFSETWFDGSVVLDDVTFTGNRTTFQNSFTGRLSCRETTSVPT